MLHNIDGMILLAGTAAMPLRDHIRSPLDDTAWQGFHGGWHMLMVQFLGKKPKRETSEARLRCS
jgi:hypothetical protein